MTFPDSLDSSPGQRDCVATSQTVAHRTVIRAPVCVYVEAQDETSEIFFYCGTSQSLQHGQVTCTAEHSLIHVITEEVGIGVGARRNKRPLPLGPPGRLARAVYHLECVRSTMLTLPLCELPASRRASAHMHLSYLLLFRSRADKGSTRTTVHSQKH